MKMKFLLNFIYEENQNKNNFDKRISVDNNVNFIKANNNNNNNILFVLLKFHFLFLVNMKILMN